MKTRGMVIGMLALVLAAGQFVAAKVNAAEADAPKMKFKYLSVEVDGKKLPKKEFADMCLVVTGNKGVVMKADKVLYEGTSTVNMDKKPWTIDIKLTKGKEKGQTIKGIFEMKDNTMRMCFGKPGEGRPTKFSSTEGGGHVIEVLQEVK